MLLVYINKIMYAIYNFIHIYFAVPGLELRAYTLSHSTRLFLCVSYFQDRVS
jgi:hypothetical protein